MTGRPTLYTDAIFAEIVERLSAGEPMASICRTEGFPKYSTVYEWCQKNAALSEAIARARDEGHDVIAARLQNVARGKDGSSGDVQRDKLIVDTDLKLLAKWNPKKYGERLDVAHSGTIGVTVVDDIKD
jgi:hypothetical protein